MKKLSKIFFVCTFLACALNMQAKNTVLQEHFDDPTTFLFGCQVLNTAGIYYDTLQSIAMTDSVVELHLTYGAPIHTNVEATITDGQSFLFGCQIVTTAGFYKDSLLAKDGRDSVITLELKVVPPCAEKNTAIEDSVELGQSYLFGCKTITPTEVGETTWKDTLVQAGNTCDSIITLTLKAYIPVPPCEEKNTAITDSVELGQSYLFGCQTITPTEVGETTWKDTLVQAGNTCDSIITLTLKAYIPCVEKNTAIIDSVELGQSYLFGCKTITPTEEGVTTWKDTLAQAGNTCDSIVTLTLKAYIPCVEKNTAITDSAVVGDAYLFGCHTIIPTEAGEIVVKDTLAQAGNTCDSIVTLTLKVWPAAREDSVDTPINLCYGETDTWRGKTVGGTAVFKDTVKNALGKDSIIISVQTTEWPAARIDSVEASRNLCFGETTTWRGKTVGGNDTHKDTVKNILDCDSIIISMTTIEWPAVRTDSVEASQNLCFGETITWRGKTVGGNDTHKDTVKNILDCDSIIISMTTIEWPAVRTDSVDEQINLCYGETHTWRGKEIGGTGLHRDTVKNILGCDSIVISVMTKDWPNVVVKNPDVMATCDNVPYEWTPYAGRTLTFTTAGDYADTVRNMLLCDSIIYQLHLDVNPSYPNIEFNDTTCPAHPYVWEGDTYTTTGDYTKILSTINGCDSVVTLHLLVAKPNPDLHAEMDNLPASCKYNAWLLMVNRVIADTTYGLNPTENQVVWYRVNGAMDNLMDEPALWDDEMLESGFYYTADKSLDGQYYALVTIPEAETEDGCGAIYRTVVLSKQAVGAPAQLVPNRVMPNGSMRLINLSEEATTVRIYDAVGQLMSEQTTAGEKDLQLRAGSAAGVYTVQVQNTVQQQTLKFIVVK